MDETPTGPIRQFKDASEYRSRAESLIGGDHKEPLLRANAYATLYVGAQLERIADALELIKSRPTNH